MNLSENAPPPPRHFEFGPFRLDPVRSRLLRGGAVVPLKAKPFQTLLVLLKNRGRDVRREDLLREVWSDAIVEENNLSQCISALRKALGEGPRDHSYIVTVPGYGYRFVAPVAEVDAETARAESAESEPAAVPDSPHMEPGAPSAPRSAARRRPLAAAGTLALLLAAGFLFAVWRADRSQRAVDALAATSPAAREAVLKGRFFWNKRTTESLHRAIGYFEQAVRLDPRLALAHSGLADSNALLWEYTSEWRYATAAKASAETAARIAPDRAETLTSRGNVRQSIDGDLSGAERDFRRAIEIDPRYATARHWYAWCLLALGRVEEATVQLQKAREIDPLSTIITSALGTARYFAGDSTGAIAEYRRALELDPWFARAHLLLGQVMTVEGRHAEAIEELTLARRLVGDNPNATGALAYAYGQAGRRADALALLDALRHRDRSAPVPPFALAQAYAGLGDDERALVEVRRACRERSVSPAVIRLDPRLAALRKLPAYPRTCP